MKYNFLKRIKLSSGPVEKHLSNIMYMCLFVCLFVTYLKLFISPDVYTLNGIVFERIYSELFGLNSHRIKGLVY
jgi:hypothetical protein